MITSGPSGTSCPVLCDARSPEADGCRRLRSAATVLIIVGMLETVLLLAAIGSGYFFSGGCVFYVWAGWKLLRRSQKTYRYVVHGASVLLALVLASYIGGFLLIIQFVTVRAVAMFYAPAEWLPFATFAYSLPVAWLVYSLQHPHTRALFDLPPTDGYPGILFLQRRVALAVASGGVLLVALVNGPHILRNPFALIAKTALSDAAVGEKVGSVQALTLHEFWGSNWKLSSTWTVAGGKAAAHLKASVSPEGSTSINLTESVVPQ